MSLHDATRWVVSYDIRDPDRGLDVVRFMKRRGVPLQYSVFLVYASADGIRRLMTELEELIAPAVDDVRAYHWTATAECEELGRSLLPEGLLISADALPTKVRRTRRHQPA